MKYLATVIIGLVVYLAIPWQQVSATDSTLELRVFPLECVFETVNDGSNQIIFITPAECGQQVGPLLGPVGNPGQGQPPVGNQGEGQGQTPGGNEPPAVPGGNNQGEGGQNRTRNTPVRVTPGIFGTIMPPQAVHQDLPINLDDYPETRSSSGSRFVLPIGEIVYFSAFGDDAIETHSITIKEVSADYVVITVASTPFDARLVLGQVKRFDATGDGRDDIEVVLRSIVNGMADMTFRYIATSDSAESTDSDEAEPVSAGTVVRPRSLGIVILMFLLLAIATTVSLLRRR